MIELNNCEVHDNTFIENAVVNAVGTVVVDSVKDEGLGSSKDVAQPSTLNPQPSTRRGRKPKAPRIVLSTFRYRWIDRQEGQLRLIRLYQLLISESFQMLSPDVQPDDWCALFMGEAKAFTLKWTGRQAHLRYLFKQMLEKEYITNDDKSAGRWEVLGSHFVNKSGRPFDQWDKQHDPKRGARTLQMFAEVLNIASAMPNMDALQADIRSEPDEFSDFESSR